MSAAQQAKARRRQMANGYAHLPVGKRSKIPPKKQLETRQAKKK
jgi:hypothetical protein